MRTEELTTLAIACGYTRIHERDGLLPFLAHFADAIRKDEREKCALLAYNYPAPDPGGSWRESIGAAIRARGKP